MSNAALVSEAFYYMSMMYGLLKYKIFFVIFYYFTMFTFNIITLIASIQDMRHLCEPEEKECIDDSDVRCLYCKLYLDMITISNNFVLYGSIVFYLGEILYRMYRRRMFWFK